MKELENFSAGNVISMSLLSKLSIRFQYLITNTASRYIQNHKNFWKYKAVSLYLAIQNVIQNAIHLEGSVAPTELQLLMVWRQLALFQHSKLSAISTDILAPLLQAKSGDLKESNEETRRTKPSYLIERGGGKMSCPEELSKHQ